MSCYVTSADRCALSQLIDVVLFINPASRMIRQALLLREKLSHAKTADIAEDPPGFITMYSAVRVRDLSDGSVHVFQLVLPEEADPQGCKVSVLHPMGLAVLGHKKGALVASDTKGGGAQWQVDEITLTPFHRCTGCRYYDTSLGCGRVMRQSNPEECTRSGRPEAKLI